MHYILKLTGRRGEGTVLHFSWLRIISIQIVDLPRPVGDILGHIMSVTENQGLNEFCQFWFIFKGLQYIQQTFGWTSIGYVINFYQVQISWIDIQGQSNATPSLSSSSLGWIKISSNVKQYQLSRDISQPSHVGDNVICREKNHMKGCLNALLE